jgi:signal transduction histidine kinase
MWEISGEYAEACNCDVACQCVWMEAPDDDHCTAALAWHITDGRYGDTDLAGRRVGMLIESDEGVMFDPSTKLDVVLLVDDEATNEERAAREELERQNDRLSEFASIVSHDLRNPLNVAKGRVDIANETNDLAHLDGARDALDRMDALMTDLLELAKQGSVIEATDAVDVVAVAEDAWANVATGGAELVDADDPIEADQDRLLQLLENLFRNSVEHGSTSSRPGTDAPLTVTVGTFAEGFHVTDTGPGIPPDERDTVFERGHSTNDGTGLGLPIVRAVAEAHGWTVDVCEADAGGARFEFVDVDRPVNV